MWDLVGNLKDRFCCDAANSGGFSVFRAVLTQDNIISLKKISYK